jgi:SSS family transporter
LLDWAVLLTYAGSILFIGWYASRGQSDAHSHLRAGRSLPGWAVVFSVLATEVSAATYIGVPEAAFKGNWNYLQFAIGALLGKWALSSWLIKLYWRLNLTTVYGLLGQRIGPLSQQAAAWAFLAGRLVASGVRLYIAALAFSVVTGMSVEAAIAIMALLSTSYTFMGGLRAVVWTDVAQGCIFFLGAATAIAFGLWKLGLPLSDVLNEAWNANKLEFLTLEDDGLGFLASTRPLPVALLGGFFLVLATHGTDQENVQHLINTKSAKSGSRSLFVSGFATFPIVAIFLAVGTMLWVYHRHLEPVGYGITTPLDQKNIFPNFIMHVLPMGLRGLVFAGLFAAAISSLGATLNAVTTAWLKDIRGGRSDAKQGLGHVRALTVVFGIALCGVGLFFSWWAQDKGDDLVQIALGAMTILYGGILGAFLSALLLARRGSDASVTTGMASWRGTSLWSARTRRSSAR